MPSKKELYDMVKDLVSEQEFQKRIDKKIKDWNDLIDENAAAALIVDELGRKRIEFIKISEVRDGLVNIHANVDSIGAPRELTTRRGPGRLVKISLSDETGKCKLALWDDDTKLIDKLGIETGKKLKIFNGSAKISRFGTDISKGRWGVIEVDKD